MLRQLCPPSSSVLLRPSETAEADPAVAARSLGGEQGSLCSPAKNDEPGDDSVRKPDIKEQGRELEKFSVWRPLHNLEHHPRQGRIDPTQKGEGQKIGLLRPVQKIQRRQSHHQKGDAARPRKQDRGERQKCQPVKVIFSPSMPEEGE